MKMQYFSNKIIETIIETYGNQATQDALYYIKYLT